MWTPNLLMQLELKGSQTKAKVWSIGSTHVDRCCGAIRYYSTGFSAVDVPVGTLFVPLLSVDKTFVWQDWMLDQRADPISAMNGGDNSLTNQIIKWESR